MPSFWRAAMGHGDAFFRWYYTCSLFRLEMLHKKQPANSQNFVQHLPKVVLDFFTYRAYKKSVSNEREKER